MFKQSLDLSPGLMLEKQDVKELADYLLQLYDKNSNGELSQADIYPMLLDAYKVMHQNYSPLPQEVEGYFKAMNIYNQQAVSREALCQLIEKYFIGNSFDTVQQMNKLDYNIPNSPQNLGKQQLITQTFTTQQQHIVIPSSNADLQRMNNYDFRMAANAYVGPIPVQQPQPDKHSIDLEEEEKIQLLEQLFIEMENSEQMAQANEMSQASQLIGLQNPISVEKQDFGNDQASPFNQNEKKFIPRMESSIMGQMSEADKNFQNYVNARLSMSTRVLKLDVDANGFISKDKVLDFVKNQYRLQTGKQLRPDQVDLILTQNHITVQGNKINFHEFREKVRKNLLDNGSSLLILTSKQSQKK